MSSVSEATEKVIQAAKDVAKRYDAARVHELRDALEELEMATPDKCKPKYEGEPSFTVVGRDKLAIETISHWLYLAEQQGVEVPGEKRMDTAKFDDAVDVLEKFKQWQTDNPDKVKLPD